MLIKVIKKKIAAKKEARKQAYRDELAANTGLYFNEELVAEDSGFPFMKYFVNALALFGSVYGTLACLVSSFRFEIADIVLFSFCALLALAMAFMYANHRVKLLFYVFILVCCFMLVSRYYIVINSGMSAIYNICLQRIDVVLDLPQIREYTEWYSNRYISMTMALCVAALALMVLMNILISEFMSITGVFLVTFPIVQIGMYFSFDSDKLPMFCVMGSWLLVAAINSTNSYNGLTRKLKAVSSVKKHRHHYGFVTDSANVARIAMVILLFLTVTFGVLLLAVPQKQFAFSTGADVWKEKTNQPVKDFLSYGFAAFFHRNSDNSNPGEIANQGSISFDGQTDMKVSLVNYGASRIYLRNFVGQRYLPYNYRWMSDKMEGVYQKSGEYVEEYMDKGTDYYFNRTGNILAFDYAHQQEIAKSRHRMEIELVDPLLSRAGILYTPYYSVVEDNGDVQFLTDGQISKVDDGQVSDVTKKEEKKQKQSVTFYTQDASARDSTIMDMYYDGGELVEGAEEYLTGEDAYYNNLIREFYLDVPDANIDVLQKFCDQHNLKKTDTDVVNRVVEILEKEYDYTLRPGRAPVTEDYVNYFLGNNKKGYCVHFASSATLILRYLGIPARYAEGYVIDAENFQYSNTLEEENVSDWLEGVVSSSAEVEEVSLTDANGHAWVEVYEYGLGWVPLEVTNAASIDSDGGFLSNLFSGSGVVSQATESVMNQVNELDVESTKQSVLRLLLLLVFMALLLYVMRMIWRVIKRYAGFSTESRCKNISNRYQNLYEIMKYTDASIKTCLSYQTFSAMLFEKEILSEEQSKAFYHSLECALFSGREIDETTYQSLIDDIRKCKRAIVLTMNWKQKFGYYFVHIMW